MYGTLYILSVADELRFSAKVSSGQGNNYAIAKLILR